MDTTDEMVDIVNTDDRVVTTVTRAVMRRDRLRHRAVFVAVTDGDGRLLVHRRSPLKDVWPGWCDIAVGGVVGSGETYDDAARRELWEELGINLVPTPVDDGIVSPYDDDVVSLLGRCYRVVSAGPFRFHDDEVVEAWWVEFGELPALFVRERFLPDSRALLWPRIGG